MTLPPPRWHLGLPAHAKGSVGDAVAVPAPHQLCSFDAAVWKAPAELERNGAESTSSL